MLQDFKKKTTTKSFISEIVNNKEALFKTNSAKVCELVIESLAQEKGLLVYGENSYQVYTRVNRASNVRCVYIPTKKDLGVYPLELNRSLVGDLKKIEGQIEKNQLAILFSSEKLDKREIHVKTKKESDLVLKVGLKTEKESLCRKLRELGYELVDSTKHIGEYSSRGSLVDVCPGTANNPVRVEFFGNTIESIRSFSAATQLTIKTLNTIKVENIKVDINPVKTITYDEFIKKNNYAVLNMEIEEEWFILKTLGVDKRTKHYSIKSGGVLNNAAKLNTIKKDKTTILIDQDDNVDVKKNNKKYAINTGWVYELLNEETIIKYKEPYDVELIHKNIEKNIKTYDYVWGDYITHESFGVGKFRGVISKNNQDYIKIEFKDGASVFLSTLKIDMIAPYIGVPRPKLNNLNGKIWRGEIESTKKRIQKIIDEMVSVNRNRDSDRVYPPKRDLEVEKFLKDSFPHVETKDQRIALESVDKDLTTPGLMDRIIIGDVGFGKTEVALRAAVKSVCSGGMVMVVVPTTILADQHYISFSKRLEKIGVQVHMLSRFVSSKNKKQICNLILANSVDILIGTHVILNDNIPKKRLSLLIVDEEHKFGVSHKNKLLKVRRGLDVLSLSATPIPRTLQQSLLGVRDVSLVQTPPINRHPIQTRVLYKEWDHIKNIIAVELSRGGQVYFLHNRVETLPVFYKKISLMFPSFSVAMAHGQMPSKDLEKTVLSFFAGNINVFVCTSIIESGLDVSNANTIIINDSHLFGLSQLYQIRGRVGRSNKQAYCYLLIPDIKKLTPVAIERLRTIESHVDLGSGYKVALKDLEIRGSGNLFGYEQSGSMSKVGYHLYCKMFEKALDVDKKIRLSNNGFKITTFFNSSFEEEYMPTSEDRIHYYQRLATSSLLEDFSIIESEVADRFGLLNEPAQNMIDVSRLRFIYNNSYVSKLDIAEDSVSFHFTKNEDSSFDLYFEWLMSNLKNSSLKYSFTKTSETSLFITVSVESGLKPLLVALNCAVYFINNKKND